ncbi:MAG: hypothetical protein MUE96_04990 [Bacteroidia bacterium]|nr:hypothetical protein [Bacteroidia bacterium]
MLHKYLFLLLTLNSCKDECQDPRNPDCENYNPCIDAKPTSAAFTIKEATYLDIIEPRLADFLINTDSCYGSSIYFEAIQADADSFIWQIGTEPEPRYGKQVNVVFPDNLRGTNFNIRLIVKRKPNTRCFPTDDGIDTVIRSFYFVRFNEPLSWEGTYYGSDDDKPDSMYTIVLGHSYDAADQEDILKVYGVPRGCKDTVNEWFSTKIVNFNNIWFQRGGQDCDGKIVRGIFKQGDKYTIRQEYVTFVNGIFNRKNRVFTGIKIN